MNDELKRIRESASLEWVKKDDGSLGHCPDCFKAGFDFCLTQLDKVPEVMAMREALAEIAKESPSLKSFCKESSVAFDKLVGMGEPGL